MPAVAAVVGFLPLLLLLVVALQPAAGSAVASVTLSEFSTLDGRNNHQAFPLRNSAQQPLARSQTPPSYADGIGDIVAGRPNPRNVSRHVYRAAKPFEYSDLGLSAMMAAFGQFVAHDMLYTPVNVREPAHFPVPCCDDTLDPACTCNETMLFFRSKATANNSAMSPRAPINFQTGWLDGSMVYGHSTQRMLLMRTFDMGKLDADPQWGSTVNTDEEMMVMPVTQNGRRGLKDLRLTGDERGNSNPPLLALHGLFILEHNRLCDLLAAQHPQWNDADLFNHARQLVIAQIQSITFNEYLPSVLGQPLPAWQGYNASVDASVSAFFAACGFRHHSTLTSFISRTAEDGTPASYGPLLLRESAFQPWSYTMPGQGSVADILRGAMSDRVGAADASFPTDVLDFSDGKPGWDLGATDIMRGRDFGLPTYNQARVALGLPVATAWEDVTDDMRVSLTLEKCFGTAPAGIDKLDAVIGGTVESPLGSSFVGPLFSASVRDQMQRTRDGDRFWYENVYAAHPEALHELRSTRLLAVIRRHFPVGDAFATSAFCVRCGGGSTGAGDGDGGSNGGNNASGGIGTNDLTVLDGNFALGWKPSPVSVADDVIRFEISATIPPQGWLALGLGAGMAGADVWVAMFQSDGSVKLVDAHAPVYATPVEDAQVQGGSNDLTLVEASYANGVATVVFDRPLLPSDAAADIASGRDRAIDLNAPTQAVFAYANMRQPPGAFEYHGSGNRGRMALQLASTGSGPNNSGILAIDTGRANEKLFVIHGVAMLFVWLVLVPGALGVVRFCKAKSYWLGGHRKIMTVATVVCIAAAVSAAALVPKSLDSTHAYLGVVVVCMTGLQWMVGKVLLYWRRQATVRGAHLQLTLRVVHRVFGGLLWPLALVNCFYGLVEIEAHDWVYGTVVCMLALLVAALLGAEVMRKKKALLTAEDAVGMGALYEDDGADVLFGAGDPTPDDVMHNSISSQSDNGGLNEADVVGIRGRDMGKRFSVRDKWPVFSREQLRARVQEGMMWVVFEGSVYDVSHVADVHPGGRAVIVAMLGKDITRHFYGMLANFMGFRHTHSAAALDLLRVRKVGEVGTTSPSSTTPGLRRREIGRSRVKYTGGDSGPAVPMHLSPSRHQMKAELQQQDTGMNRDVMHLLPQDILVRRPKGINTKGTNSDNDNRTTPSASPSSPVPVPMSVRIRRENQAQGLTPPSTLRRRPFSAQRPPNPGRGGPNTSSSSWHRRSHSDLLPASPMRFAPVLPEPTSPRSRSRSKSRHMYGRQPQNRSQTPSRTLPVVVGNDPGAEEWTLGKTVMMNKTKRPIARLVLLRVPPLVGGSLFDGDGGSSSQPPSLSSHYRSLSHRGSSHDTQHINSIDTWGTYWQVSPPYNEFAPRRYSVVRILDEQDRQELASPSHTQLISLWARKYRSGVMSTRLHSLEPGDPLFLSGPYPGDITHADLAAQPEGNRHIMCIAGGTGVLPFLDLIDALTKHTCTGQAPELRLMPLLELDVQLTLMCGFAAPDDVIGFDWLMRRSALAEETFKVNIRVMEDPSGGWLGGIGHFPDDEVAEALNLHADRRQNDGGDDSDVEDIRPVTLVYVCGPTRFMKNIREVLTRVGYRGQVVMMASTRRAD